MDFYKRSFYLLGTCIFLGFFFSCAGHEKEEAGERPNIVIIVADDMGWTDLSCYGNGFIETSNLDALAKKGIRFTDAYAGASLCSPSRAALLTGKHPVRVNITEHMHGNQPAGPGQRLVTPFIDQALNKSHQTIAEMIQPAGYECGYFGKWHLGGGKNTPEYRGFDVNIGGSYNGLPKSFFYPFFKKGSMPSLQEDANEGDYLTDVLTDHAIDFINNNKDSSFLCLLSYYSPHVPIEAKAELVEKYKNKRLDKANQDSLPNAHYAAMIESIDQNVGRVIKTLRDQGILNNTLIIFTSDNGGLHVREVPAFAKHTPPLTNDPLKAGKGYLYEGGIRVPMIVSWQGHIDSGHINTTPVIGQDIYNTIAELIEIEAQSPDGQSLLPVFFNGEFKNRDLYWHVPHYTPQGSTPSSAIRSGDFKLIEFYESERFELYDLKNDLSEQRDLSDDREDVLDSLKTKLRGWKERMNAEIPKLNQAYEGE